MQPSDPPPEAAPSLGHPEETQLRLEIQRQPDDTSCGFTCLHAVYRYYGDEIPLEQVIAETGHLEAGGTLGVFLGCHAVQRGYRCTIYTYNIQVFDPTWFGDPAVDLSERLQAQRQVKADPHIQRVTDAYVEFLQSGGQVRFEDLTTGLIRRYLKRGRPLLTGLSATYLYRSAREFGPRDEPDDVRGYPVGHFVILRGYDPERREVLVADPLHPNPLSQTGHYSIGIDRVICAVLLGILTHDANLLIIEPRERERARL